MKRTIQLAGLTVALLLAYVPLRSLVGPGSGSNPLATLMRSPLDAVPIRGRVEESLPAGSYTYLKLRSEQDALLWAVTLGRGAPPGARVAVRGMGRSKNFYSRRLERTFPDLVFGIVSRLD